ncbi:MAG: hypothetical protein R6X02_16210 [Enhygromyxa sp.]
MKTDLVRRIAGTIDVRDAGLGLGLVALVVLVLGFGVVPTAIAIGLLALLVID